MRKFSKFAFTIVVIVALALTPPADASFCGKSGVPFSFEVLASGAPVLGCAQPSCVFSPPGAAGADGSEAADFVEDSEFLTDVNGQADGFFRRGDRNAKHFRYKDAPKLIANCSGAFNELSCPRKNQWVGGIEYIDHPRQPLILQCCTFPGLRFSQEVGSTTVGPGEAITGGEVIRSDRQISFDVIANVKKVVKEGRIGYEVTVRRMNCLPDPPEPEVQFEEEVPSEVFKVLSSASNKDLGTAEKFEKKNSALKIDKKPKSRQQAAPNEQLLPEISDSTGAGAAVGGGSQPQPQQQQQQQQQQQFQPQQPSQFQPDAQQQQQQAQQAQQQAFVQQQLPVQPQPQQQPQQPSPAFGAPADALFSTPFPTFPTLPPHTFPPGFPTLPPHTFPTFVPHTFPTHTFHTHTFPTHAAFAAHTFPAGFPTFAPLGVTPAPAAPFPGFPAFGPAAAPLAPVAPSSSAFGVVQPSPAAASGSPFGGSSSFGLAGGSGPAALAFAAPSAAGGSGGSQPLAPLPDASSQQQTFEQSQPQLQEQTNAPTQSVRGSPDHSALPSLVQAPSAPAIDAQLRAGADASAIVPPATDASNPIGAGGAFSGGGGSGGAFNSAVTGPTPPPMFPMFPTMMPTPAPAMGTILTQLGGNVHPIMLPGLGIVGYSNAPQKKRR